MAPEWEQDQFPALTPSRTSKSSGLGPRRSPVCKRDKGAWLARCFGISKKIVLHNFGLGGSKFGNFGPGKLGNFGLEQNWVIFLDLRNWVILDLDKIGKLGKIMGNFRLGQNWIILDLGKIG